MAAYNALFSIVLRMSLTGSIVIALVLLVRLVLRRAPRIFSYLLWSVVLLRLLCPVSFSSALSVFQVIDAPVASQGLTQEETAYVLQGNGWPAAQAGLQATAEQTLFETEGVQSVVGQAPARQFWSFQLICGFVWLVGVVVLWGYSAISGLGLRQRLVGAVRSERNIYLCDYIGTAFVLGVLRPRIYLPTALTQKEREYILLHEQTHIQRGDHIWRLLAFLALSVHWFNPLVWCAFFLSERDMEMSCDETVLRKLATDIRADYSASLLNLASGKRVFAGAPLGFGEGNVKCRIKNIMRYKKTAALIAIPALALVVIVLIVLGSNPVQETADEPQGVAAADTPEGLLVIPEKITITAPVIDKDMICGVDGPILDYADESTLVFHDYFGLFVYNTEENKLLGAVDLEPIGCQYTQGDAYCEVRVSQNGQMVYLHPLNIEDMYVYEATTQTLTCQPYNMEGVELFTGLRVTNDCVMSDPTVLRSAECVPLQEERYVYLESGSGMAADLYYIIERNGERMQFAMLFETLIEQEAAQQSPFAHWFYTGWLDECVAWSGYESFIGQDYDGDGTTDRVWRECMDEQEYCSYRIEFGNGDLLELEQMGNGMPYIETCDLNGDGVRELLFQQSYGFSTDPNAFGEVALFEKKGNRYEQILPPEELCTYMEGTISPLHGGFDYYTPCITVNYRKLSERELLVSVEELTGAAALEEQLSLNDDLGWIFNQPDAEQIYRSTCYEIVPVNDGKRELLEFHFEVFFKWSLDEIIVTAAYEDGALHVVGSRLATEAEKFGGKSYDISPEEATVIPEVEELSYENAVRLGTVREYDREEGGTLPGFDFGVWYSVEVDGVEYFYARYDYDEENCVLFSWALLDDSHVLANGIRVGMTAEEALTICPDMVRLGFEMKGYPAWNRTGYPQHWTDAFDEMLVANIEDNIDNLPIFLALMIKDDRVAAITKYAPTAG